MENEVKKELRFYNSSKIGVWATVAFFVFFIVGLIIGLSAKKALLLTTGHIAGDIALGVGLVLVGVVLHEAIHGASSILFGKCKKEDIKFGFKPKEGLFYCHCEKAVTLKSYRITLIMPLIITGLVPYVLSVAFAQPILTAAFSLLIAGATGDVIMFFGSLKDKDADKKIIDHPTEFAYYIINDENEQLNEVNAKEELIKKQIATTDKTEITELKEITEKTEETELTENGKTEKTEDEVITGEKKKGAGSLGIKILLIALFVSLMVLAYYVIALIMEFI